jgi:signal transduction histidine kinase
MLSAPKVHRRTSPGSLLLLSLVAILAVSVGLGYHALTTARTHRESVENALRDYASMAAWEYSSLARENLSDFLSDVFDDVTRGWRSSSELPSPRALAEDARRMTRWRECACPEIRSPASFFRIDLQDNTIISDPDTVSAAMLSRLADTLTSHRREHADQRTGLMMMPAGSLLDSPALVTYSTSYSRRRTARAVFGFVTTPSASAELLGKWFVAQPLLPPAVTDGQPNDSLLYLSLHTVGNATLFESAISYPTTYGASDTMGVEYGGVIVEAAIRPDVADRLIIGGVPRSRLPLILAVLLITIGLGTAALVQIRREYRLARLRDDFVSGVSHELRTPLAQVRIFAELLETGKLRTESERRRALGIMNRETRRLTHLVENILQFSRSARATADLKIERLDVAKTVCDVIEAFRPLALARNVLLDSEIEEGLAVRADRDAINQVLLNLLDNAVKYGPDGQTVTIRAAREGNTLRLSVDDEGPGIPRNEWHRIWEPYRRLQRDSEKAVTGTGIGLAMVGELVGLHDGGVRIEDSPDGGARFVVELPGATSRPDASVTAASEARA